MALKEKADKDLSQYNTELKELMRIIEHDRKLKEFMRIKSEERAVEEGELSSQRKKKDEKERGDKAEETIEVCKSPSQLLAECLPIRQSYTGTLIVSLQNFTREICVQSAGENCVRIGHSSHIVLWEYIINNFYKGVMSIVKMICFAGKIENPSKTLSTWLLASLKYGGED